jgi:hypothetical protein
MDDCHWVGGVPGALLDVYRHPQSQLRGCLRGRRPQRELAQRVGLRTAMGDFGKALRLLQASQYIQVGSHRLLPGRVNLAHAPLRASLDVRG